MPTGRTLQEVLQAAIDARVEGIHVAMPAKVISFNKSRNTVDVSPQFKRVVEAEETGELTTEDYPTIPDVPIAWPRGGGHWITWPLAKGDTITVVCLDYDPGMWRATGQAGTPGDLRAHGLAGAVAYPGISTEAATLSASQIADDAICIGAKTMLGSATATQAMILGNLFKAYFDTHIHATAFGPTAIPSVLMPTNTLSTKHKLDS